MPDPITGEGFNAPSPEVAYMGAPDMVEELLALTRIATRLQAEAADASAHGEPYEPDEHAGRLYLLRRAALADRLSLAHPEVEEFLTDAVQLSQNLARFDREHDTHVGPHGPSSIEWDPSARPHVRQEYDHWEW
ncbi:hypothetical protein [Streptomyces sp. NBC_01750]|uniref:hypothetical protein n=1 Tax=Streptomyces sp. NBC_01750 TaxID=2975928 RepID=UPI002DD80EB9|nr:hypothetical protein [Streptomyces sp. NBC_01750]WSD38116.1 hypothetical protein OG966_40150 [Streptomyces sp. NBC_01750]